MSDAPQLPGDDEIGRGKPPKPTQWKPKQSGNPEGRRKCGQELGGDLIDKILREKIPCHENGRSISITRRRACARTMVDRGIAGDPACENILIKIEGSDLSERSVWFHMLDVDHEDEIPARQQQVINSYRNRRVKANKRRASRYGDQENDTPSQQDQPGSRRGRPKDDVSLAELVKRELNKLIKVQDNEKTRTVTKREAWMRRVINGAMNGDRRCLRTFTKIVKLHKRPGAVHNFFWLIGRR